MLVEVFLVDGATDRTPEMQGTILYSRVQQDEAAHPVRGYQNVAQSWLARRCHAGTGECGWKAEEEIGETHTCRTSGASSHVYTRGTQ